MRTITFYSYKGGVGRTLALANLAKRLSEFGKKVCVLDFDMEAPGLHYKFKPHVKPSDITKGIVDYIHHFNITKEVPERINDYAITINYIPKKPPIILIPAGDVSSTKYWKKLAAINWNDLFYKTDSEGIAFFLDLKEKIKEEINPEFLLVDSRTGITEVSGITISLFADQLVIMAAHNDESIDGAKQVIYSIKSPENKIFGKSPEILFVLSRIPYPENPHERGRDLAIKNDAERAINSYLKDKKCNYHINDTLIIHSDRELEIKETLKIGYSTDKKNVPIASDYLNLFHKLTSDILTEEEIDRFNKIKEAEQLVIESYNVKSDKEKIELLNKAIELNPENEYAYNDRGSVHYNLKEYQNALNNFNKTKEINPKHYLSYYNIGWVYLKQQKYKQALTNFNKAIELSHKKEFLYLARAELYELMNKNKKALNDFDKAVKLAPENHASYNNRADFYRKTGKYHDALKDVYKSLELNVSSGYPHSTLAEIHAELNKTEEFYLHFELALSHGFSIDELVFEDKAYKLFLKEDRFIKLLEKYDKNELAKQLRAKQRSKR